MYLIYGNSQIEIQEKINEIIQENNSNNVIKYSYIENELLDILEDASYISMFEEKKIIFKNSFGFSGLTFLIYSIIKVAVLSRP